MRETGKGGLQSLSNRIDHEVDACALREFLNGFHHVTVSAVYYVVSAEFDQAILALCPACHRDNPRARSCCELKSCNPYSTGSRLDENRLSRFKCASREQTVVSGSKGDRDNCSIRGIQLIEYAPGS